MKHKRYTTERERNFEQLLDRYKLALNARCVFWFGGNAEKAKEILGWEAEFGLEKMCRDAWNFMVKNPNGL